ncbi:MAG: hypothetical protein V3V61_02345 [Gammaproteobacteria bacterium]
MAKNYRLVKTPIDAELNDETNLDSVPINDTANQWTPSIVGENEEDDDGGGDDGGSGEFKPGELIGAPREETSQMVTEQRLLEQEGHRHWSKVNVREKREYSGEPGPGLEQHPADIFDSQRFDGVDINISAVFPPVDALAALEDARKEQELRIELRNQHQNSHTNSARSTPTFTR